jgi:hypothetical protein
MLGMAALAACRAYHFRTATPWSIGVMVVSPPATVLSTVQVPHVALGLRAHLASLPMRLRFNVLAPVPW